ncbi:hypothetical protein J4Q44_G00088090, partial [Coregonus suidteri]
MENKECRSHFKRAIMGGIGTSLVGVVVVAAAIITTTPRGENQITLYIERIARYEDTRVHQERVTLKVAEAVSVINPRGMVIWVAPLEDRSSVLDVGCSDKGMVLLQTGIWKERNGTDRLRNETRFSSLPQLGIVCDRLQLKEQQLLTFKLVRAEDKTSESSTTLDIKPGEATDTKERGLYQSK